jgi:acyl carrier protein
VDVATRIREFIRQEILFEDSPSAVTDETPLLNGVMDSLGLMQLVAFVEEEFGVEIEDAEMTSSHFRTVADVEELVGRKVAQKA